MASLGFVAAGCNAILGLDPTQLEPDAERVHAHITRQALTALPDVIAYSAIENLDTIKIGPLDETLPGDVPVDTTDGAFDVPEPLKGRPYRLVYQPLGDPVPHEVQWPFETPHICVPFFGQPGRPAPPANATIQFDVQGHPTGFDAPMVFSYGTSWTVGALQTSAPNPVDYPYTSTGKSIDGPLPNLQSGTDTEMLVDFTSGTATGGARFSADLLADMTVLVSAPWLAPLPTTIKFAPSGSVFNRMLSAMGNLVGAAGTVEKVAAGVIPSANMPSFALRPLQDPFDPLSVPMFQLAQATNTSNSPAMFVDPFTDPDLLPTVIALQSVQVRMAGTAKLVSGFQWAWLGSQITENVAIDSPQIGIPTMVTLNDVMLRQDDDLQIMLLGATTTVLKFSLDLGADDCIATLYQVGATLAPLRSYEVIADPPIAIQIDTRIFQASTKYVFGIVCRLGLPAARAGLFDTIRYPFAVSTEFPSTFTVVP